MNNEQFHNGGIVNVPAGHFASEGSDNTNRPEAIIPPEIMDKMLMQYRCAEDEAILNGTRKSNFKSLYGAALVQGKIGIGITTHNRPKVFEKTLLQILKFVPENAEIALIDDCSNDEYMYNLSVEHHAKMPNLSLYRFDLNVGIARAKNKALELLYNAGCEHFFLFDDDTYTLVDNWWQTYVESTEPHLMYIFQHFANAKGPNDMIEVYRDDKIAAYSHVRGCMLYYKRVVLDVVGGMDTVFGRWGHEHGDLSNRIYSAGLSSFRYMDVANSKGLFYAADEQEHGTFVSTVPGAQRNSMLAATKAIYDAQYDQGVYRDFREVTWGNVDDKKPLFLSTYFTTLGDPQREGKAWEYDYKTIEPFLLSIAFKAPSEIMAVILSDTQEEKLAHRTYFKRVPVSGNPYFQRWMSYYSHLIRHRDKISWVFMTDCTDVELLKMPEPKQGVIYVGDEPGQIVKNQWITYHHKHPRLQRFYKYYGGNQIVNAGILGGYVEDVLPFIRAIIDEYTQMKHDEATQRLPGNMACPGPGMTDMAVFNYVAYMRFKDKISHGQHVNTTFKANERNDISWWKHK